MNSEPRLLVIGSTPLGEEVQLALPDCAQTVADCAVAGVWQAGHRAYDAILLGSAGDRYAQRTIQSLRQVAPQARIVAVCQPPEKAGSAPWSQLGADECVMMPVTPDNLRRALRLPAVERPGPVQPASFGDSDVVELLSKLGEGPQAMLIRLATTLQAAFAASFASIVIDGQAARAGEIEPAAFQMPVLRGGVQVGTIEVGRLGPGVARTTATARLITFAALSDAIYTAARERTHWQELAWTDDLSRLRNRRFFEARLTELIAQGRKNRTYLTVLLFDIDDFKRYNDQFGHETGDALIREVAFLLVRCSRDTDVVARYGGDEFAVVIWDAEKPRVPGSHHPSQFIGLAERFRQAIGTHTFKCLGPAAPGPVTVSGGLSCFPWDGHDPAQLLQAADDALRVAKRTGKNRIELAGGGPG